MLGASAPDAADRFHDDDSTDLESCDSSALSTPTNEKSAWIQQSTETVCDDDELDVWSSRKKELDDCGPQQDLESARINTKSKEKRWTPQSRRGIALLLLAVLIALGAIFALSYFTLLGALLERLSPYPLTNGLHRLAFSWQEPDAYGPSPFNWPADFSRDIVPKNCHSHNDYWRSAPVYSALAAGCTGIEADIWLRNDGDLYVAHDWRWISEYRTLRNLYLEPLYNIFEQRNVSMASVGSKEVGVWDVDPNASVTLLIDFKNDGVKNTGEAMWPVLMEQLAVFQMKNWLTYYNGTTLVPGPLTIVATGHVSFDLIQAQELNRYVFYDAPLDDIANPLYNATNSYYSSTSLRKAIGRPWFTKLSSSQVETIQEQVAMAEKKGLLSRYWGTPAWPISARNRIWAILRDAGVGMLNVDDLEGATRWNWDWCTVAGLNVCG